MPYILIIFVFKFKTPMLFECFELRGDVTLLQLKLKIFDKHKQISHSEKGYILIPGSCFITNKYRNLHVHCTYLIKCLILKHSYK